MQVLLINIFFIYPKNFTYLKKREENVNLNNALFKLWLI